MSPMKGLGRTVAIYVVVAAIAALVVPGLSGFSMTRTEAAALAVFGLIVGIYGTMVGAGGGFLIVPVLLLVWQLPPAQAAGTSLLVVFLNATAGSLAFAKQGRIDFRSGLWFAAATVPGAVAGAFLARYFSGRAFDIAFGSMLLAVAAFLMWKPVRRVDPSAEQPGKPGLGLGIALSVGVGFVSSALGIGGGIFHVPAMIHLLHFPALVATATSTFILAFSSLIGAGTHVALGNVLFGPAVLMGIGAVAGAQIGGEIAKRARGATVVRLLSLALVLVGVRLLLRS
ncbi:MAG TPA: sulfite exporter TauE/SafE family protein [Gemmatimonadaceae bacterium]|nr:sulfite exporter TauE/SafE family protein [Gemmatimonadaceae bacterium]